MIGALKKTGSLLVLAMLATGCVSSQRYAALEMRYESEQTARAGLSSRVDALQKQKAALSAELSVTRSKLDEANRRYHTQLEETGRQNKKLALAHKKMASMEEKQQGLSKKLEKAMQDLARQEGIDYEPGSGRLKLSAQVLFEPGQSALSANGRQALAKLAEALKGGREWLRVEGHTDADPVRKTRARWRHGNWELSGYRALAVLAVLEQEGVEGQRMRFVGRGPYAPSASNLTEVGKAQNRRVEIYILPGPKPSKLQR